MIDFDLIKGRIQRFTRTSIIEDSLDILTRIQKEKEKTYPFWNLLVLIKWTLIYSRDSGFRLKANRQDVIETMQLIEQFEDQRKVIDFKLGIGRGMRIIAYQQFWFQGHIRNHVFDRQLVLYCKIKTPFNINEKFKDAYSGL